MEKSETATDQGAASTDWQKMMHEYLIPLFKPWTEMFQNPGSGQPFQSKGRLDESLQANVRMLQTMLGAMSDPTTLEHYQKATEKMPNIALELTHTCLQGVTSMQAKAGEWIKKRGAALSSADIQELDSELIKNLTETYDKEFSRYLKIPRLD